MVKEEVIHVKDSVTMIRQKQEDMDAREKGRASVKFTQHRNSQLGPHQILAKLPYTLSGRPLPSDLEQPRTWAHLAVGGTEVVPRGSIDDNLTKWNRTKSRSFLKAVLDHDDESDGSDNENSLRARASRRAVAKAIGVEPGNFESLLRVE